MEDWLYVMMIKKTKEYRKLNRAGVIDCYGVRNL